MERFQVPGSNTSHLTPWTVFSGSYPESYCAKTVQGFSNVLIGLLTETRHFLIFQSLPVWLMFKSMTACQTLTALLGRLFLFYITAYLLLPLYCPLFQCPKGIIGTRYYYIGTTWRRRVFLFLTRTISVLQCLLYFHFWAGAYKLCYVS